jgi:hypothetical protein
MDIGLIKSYDDPPYCKKWSQGIACELRMKIGNVSKLIDGKRWKCTKYCNGSKSIRDGSIFFRSKLSLPDCLILIWIVTF